MAFLYSFLSSLLSVLFTISTPFSILTGQTLKATNPDNIKLCFSAISDTHLTESPVRDTMLKQGFKDMSREDSPLDAVVMPGDLTDHGEKVMFDHFFADASELRVANLIATTGNHDTWSEDGIEAGMGYFVDGYNAYTGRSITKPYYSTLVNGYTFITLASEGDSTTPDISDAQVLWLSDEMSKAAQAGLPIFVVCHFLINGVNGQEELWEDGGIGAQSDAIRAILKQYDNVFFISGHMHSGLMGSTTQKIKGYSSIESDGSLHFINVPCYTYLNTSAGNPLSGCGYLFEVYDDYVLIRARNYAMSYWLEMYDTRLELV